MRHRPTDKTAAAVAADDKKDETVTVLSSAPVQEVPLATPSNLAEGTPPARSALDKNPERAEDAEATEPPAEVRHYIVERGGSYTDPNTRTRTTIREGKVITNQTYDVIDLQRQGIKIKRYTPERLDESGFVT